MLLDRIKNRIKIGRIVRLKGRFSGGNAGELSLTIGAANYSNNVHQATKT
jgi:hypothetical protein